MKSRQILSVLSKSSRTGCHCLYPKQLGGVEAGGMKIRRKGYYSEAAWPKSREGGWGGHNKKPTTELGPEASTPTPSQGDEPVFVFLMTLETETHGKHNDSFILIQGMVRTHKKRRVSSATSYSVSVTCVT